MFCGRGPTANCFERIVQQYQENLVRIGKLVLLREFDISNNSLEHLPPEIGLCARIKKIRLNGNRLKELPKELET